MYNYREIWLVFDYLQIGMTSLQAADVAGKADILYKPEIANAMKEVSNITYRLIIMLHYHIWHSNIDNVSYMQLCWQLSALSLLSQC